MSQFRLFVVQTKCQGDRNGQLLALQVDGDGGEPSDPADGVPGGFVQEVMTRGAAHLRCIDLAASGDGKHYHYHPLDIAAAGHQGIFFLFLQEPPDFLQIALEGGTGSGTGSGASSTARSNSAAGPGSSASLARYRAANGGAGTASLASGDGGRR